MYNSKIQQQFQFPAFLTLCNVLSLLCYCIVSSQYNPGRYRKIIEISNRFSFPRPPLLSPLTFSSHYALLLVTIQP